MDIMDIKFLKVKISHGNGKGFTLIETLVGISILLTAVVVPMVFLAGNITAAYHAKDKVTALYLAEDAIDFVKYRLATNLNAQVQTGLSTPNWLLDTTASPQNIDTTCNPACAVDSFNDMITTCPSGSCTSPIKIDSTSGAYGYTPGWTDTKFTRTITLIPNNDIVPDPPDTLNTPEVTSINVTVSWLEGGILRKIKLGGYSFYWNGNLPYSVAP